ncbi:MAG: ribosome silencing factor [Spirochaetes bacterium]|nr:ribosome silencing factor [Spirochaetota bacterium]MBU1079412.1 ribosome silencing factor [Spirochaetota bacterium]
MAEHNGGDTVVLDLRKLSTWTDFFIVTSATSSTHLRGLARWAEDYLGPLGYSPLRRPRLAEDEQWCLLDFGDFVVHIMAAEAREFYELEKLWFGAEATKVDAPEPPAAARPDR